MIRKSYKRWLRRKADYFLVFVCTICSSTFLNRRAFLNHEYNGDIDTFLYQAWRLTGGGLNYIDHYDSKLPIVQYIFTPSFLTGSFYGHRLISDIILGSCGFLVFGITNLYGSRYLRIAAPASKAAGAAAGCLFIFFGSVLPDTAYSGHLFLFSTFFLLSGLLLILRACAESDDYVVLAIGGCLCGMAIQVRPNVLISTLGMLIFFCSAYCWLYKTELTKRRLYLSTRQICWVSAFAILGFTLPFLPYAFNSEHATKSFELSYSLLKAWRRDVFGWDSMNDFTANIAYLYSPKILGIPYWQLLPVPSTVAAVALVMRFSRDDKLKKRFILAYLTLAGFSIGGLVSYLVSHTFPNYIFADLWVYCTAISFPIAIQHRGLAQLGNVQVVRTRLFCIALALGLCVNTLRLKSQEDTRTFFAPQELLELLKGNRFSSPQNYSLYWRLKEKSSTFAVHSHWTEYANLLVQRKDLLEKNKISSSVQGTCIQYLDNHKKYLVLFSTVEEFMCGDQLTDWILIKEFVYREHGPPVSVYLNTRFID